MDLRFYIDSGTGAPHIHRHKVTEDEVAQVIENPGEDRAGSEGARTEAGRHLRVVYVPEPGGAFVITAYELKGKPLMAYRRRRRRKATR